MHQATLLHLLRASRPPSRLCLLSRRHYSVATNTDTIKIQDHPAPHTGRIRVLLLDQPHNRNALSYKICRDLAWAIEDIQSPESHDVRALVIASNLDNCFCAGADLKERKAMRPDEVRPFLTSVRATFTALSNLCLPTISSIASYALGGGLELALTTHFRVVASTAVLGLPETRLAIFPGAGGTYRLPAVIGLDKARDLILTGRRVGGREACEMGLGSRLVDVPIPVSADGKSGSDMALAREMTLEASLDLAKEICEGGPVGVRQALKAVNAWREGEEGMLGPYEVVTRSEDRVAALTAFAERRKPRFVGR